MHFNAAQHSIAQRKKKQNKQFVAGFDCVNVIQNSERCGNRNSISNINIDGIYNGKFQPQFCGEKCQEF